MAVAQSLRDAGYEAWAPTKVIQKRRPRSTQRREVTLAVLPGYVFAKAVHLTDLLVEASRPVSRFPKFTVFRYCGRIPLVSERSLDNLRKIERRNTPEKAARQFKKGEAVRITEGGFAGMTGVVKVAKGRYTLVLVDGFANPIRITRMATLEEFSPQPNVLAA